MDEALKFLEKEIEEFEKLFAELHTELEQPQQSSQFSITNSDNKWREEPKNTTAKPPKEKPAVKPKPSLVQSSDTKTKLEPIQEHNGCKLKILPKPNIPPKPKI